MISGYEYTRLITICSRFNGRWIRRSNIKDNNFFTILRDIHPETKFFDDLYFTKKVVLRTGWRFYRKWGGLLKFNSLYNESMAEIFDCDYFIMNSRLYTRLVFTNFEQLKRKYPRTKLLVIHHHSNHMEHSGLLRMIHKHYELKILRAATTLIIPNQYIIDHLAADFGLTNAVYLPSAFNKKSYEVSTLNYNRLLFCGSVEYRKGLTYGLQAFKVIHDVLPQYKFHIVGSIPANFAKYYAGLLKYIRDNHLEHSVIFEGRVPQERLDWLYSHSDLFLFPSLLEGYGMVISEAMARGLPVAAFNNSAIPYTVKDNVNGLLIENKNAELMGQRVSELLQDKDRMSQLQRGALDSFAKTIDINDLNRLTEEYIRSLK